MKSICTFVLLSLSLSTQAHATSCVITSSGGNAPFASSSDRIDREYVTHEKAVTTDVTFYLRSGHGVVRLEALRNGKLFANTFIQLGIDGDCDSLRLAVGGGQREVEAHCYCVNAAVEQSQSDVICGRVRDNGDSLQIIDPKFAPYITNETRDPKDLQANLMHAAGSCKCVAGELSTFKRAGSTAYSFLDISAVTRCK